MFLDITFNSESIEVFGMVGFAKGIWRNQEKRSTDSGLIQEDEWK